ncbi:MAG: NAD(P)H-dependent oxidoreductase subunit E [Deltaproteobacteria bacterium]|jgi:NADH-quinone oxidoreductase subunit E|nr:NAD(P)H-dependent oxidoreductase subunit E [Deltaproteobacteria bacterium]
MSQFDSQTLDDLLAGTPTEPRHLLPFLQRTQEKFRHLPREALLAAAEHFSLPASRVFAVASFYKALSLVPKGERLIAVCQGTACHLRGGPQVAASLEKRLGLKIGQTSADGRYGLESVNCLGACALAPVATVDGAVRGHLTPGRAMELL